MDSLRHFHLKGQILNPTYMHMYTQANLTLNIFCLKASSSASLQRLSTMLQKSGK